MALNFFYRSAVIWQSSFADGECVNVLDYQMVAEPLVNTEPINCADLSRGVRDSLIANALPNMSNIWVLDRVETFCITQPIYQGFSVSGATGAVATETVPLKSAIVIAKKTGLRGRSYNGRFYFPAPPEDQQLNGLLSAAALTAYTTIANGLITITLGSGNSWQMVVYSETLATGTLVTSIQVRDILGTQRGRQTVKA